MKIRNRLLSWLCVCCLAVCGVSLTACDGGDETPTPSQGLKYMLSADKNSYTVMGMGACTDTQVIIPAEYNALPVTQIGTAAFHDCMALTSVVIPDSVTAIGASAFYECRNLISVQIPDGITEIGNATFYNCRNLEDAALPDSVTRIGENAFYECRALTSFTMPAGVTSIENDAFYGCYRLVEVVNKSSLVMEAGKLDHGHISFHALAVYNKTDAFTGTKLSKQDECLIYTDGAKKSLVRYLGEKGAVVLPSYLTEINAFAFYNDVEITSIVIPDGVTRIGVSSFYKCNKLTSVVIGKAVQSVELYAFRDCNKLQEVYYKGTAEEWSGITVAGYNPKLTGATRYYYSESQPTDGGNYWHYGENGAIVVWE